MSSTLVADQGSFPYLVDAVGVSGEVVGVEISPDIARNARNRIATNHWDNVQILESRAETAQLSGEFDGLLLFAAQDVLTSPEALTNLFSHLKDGARVAVFSGKLSKHRLGSVLSPLLRKVFSRLSFSTSAGIDDQPWLLLQEFVPDLEVEDHALGLMFLAWGTAVKRVRSL